MPEIAQIELKTAIEVARATSLQQAPNGIRYGSYGENQLPAEDLERMVQAVPPAIAAALHRRRYYFVPLTLSESYSPETSETVSEADSSKLMITADFSEQLSDAAICHRNAAIDGTDCTFISTRLMQDRFALFFEFYINAGHHFVEAAGVPESFMQLVWSQAEAGVRGETSQDAWGQRAKAMGSTNSPPKTASQTKRRRLRVLPDKTTQRSQTESCVIDEKARTEYLEAAFSDAVAIYLLSLTVDFDYSELREREYPLLAAPALAARLQHVSQLFPAVAGHEFSIRYRRNR